MARVTAESLMAPGGLLDAGSRLTQTLINVPFQREQFRAGLDEKALMLKREDDVRAKNDKVGYLKDRIATVQQQIATLRRSMDVGDKLEAAMALKSLNKNGLGAAGPNLSKNASEAVNEALKQATDYEIDQRKQMITKLGEAFSSKDEQGIADRTSAVREKALAEVRKQYPNEPWDVSAGLSLKGIDLDTIRADPQLKTELDAALDQQSQLFEQYRQLVGQADDTVNTHAFLQQTMPNLAPNTKAAEPALGPPGTNPQDYQNLPATQPPPMATLPGTDTKNTMVTAAQRLDDPSVISNLAQNANPLQQDQLMQQQQQSAPELNQQLQTLNAATMEGQNAGMQPQELAKIQGVLDQKKQARSAILHNALSMAAFGQATPETIDATSKLLATVSPAGQDLLFQEIQGNEQARRNNRVNPSAGEVYSPDQYSGPQMTPILVPRLQALAPPGVLPAQQAAQQRDIRSRLSAQGLYPR